MPHLTKRRAVIATVALAALVTAGAFALGSSGHNPMAHHMGGHEGMHAGQHDEVNMPGLRGKNVTEQETAEMVTMFRNFETITREVENLPDGIRTVTRSSDPAVMAQLVSHVVGMIDRVDTGDDPQVFIQSPTLDVFFDQGNDITTEIDIADTGIIVVQTAKDPALVKAMQTHAAEVTAMADRGMDAVHEMMADR